MPDQPRGRRIALRAATLVVPLALAACAVPPPPPGEVIRAEVLWTHRADAPPVPPVTGPALDTGATAAALREGRLLRLRCALGEGAVFLHDAIADQPGAHPNGTVVRVAVGPPHRVLGADGGQVGSFARVWTGQSVQLLPWSTAPIEAPATPEVERHHARVRGQFLLRCVAPG